MTYNTHTEVTPICCICVCSQRSKNVLVGARLLVMIQRVSGQRVHVNDGTEGNRQSIYTHGKPTTICLAQNCARPSHADCVVIEWVDVLRLSKN